MARSKSPLSTHTFPRPAQADDEAEARIPGLGDADRLLADGQSLAELPPLGEAQRQPGPGEDGGQPRHVGAIVQEIAADQLEVLAEGVHRPRVLAERMVGLTEPQVRRDAQGRSSSRGSRASAPSSPLGRPDDVLVVAHPPEPRPGSRRR